MSTLPANLEMFSCERLSARLTVRSCGLRFLRVRGTTPGQQDYDSACDRCPVGEHHAKHGTRFSGTQITEEQKPMGTSTYSDEEQRAAVRRVVIDEERRAVVAKDVGVSVGTISNWLKRWRTQVSGESLDAALGDSVDEEGEEDVDELEDDEPETEPAACESREMPPLVPVSLPGTRSTVQLPSDLAPSADFPRRDGASNDLVAVLEPYLPGIGVTGSTDARPAITWLADRLSRAVCRIPDRDARSAVADAAWLLAEAARG